MTLTVPHRCVCFALSRTGCVCHGVSATLGCDALCAISDNWFHFPESVFSLIGFGAESYQNLKWGCWPRLFYSPRQVLCNLWVPFSSSEKQQAYRPGFQIFLTRRSHTDTFLFNNEHVPPAWCPTEAVLQPSERSWQTFHWKTFYYHFFFFLKDLFVDWIRQS